MSEKEYNMEEELPLEEEVVNNINERPPKLIKGNWRGQRLIKGLKGEPIKQLQILLVENGLYVDGKIDGIYSDKTEESVKEFKEKESLIKNGVAEETTYNLLRKQEDTE